MVASAEDRAHGPAGTTGWGKARKLPALMWAVAALVRVGAEPALAAAQQATASSLVFDDVTVVDVVQGKLVPGQRVIVEGHRIQSVGSLGSVTIPKGARVVDARGKYLIPGLWDMHVHPGLVPQWVSPVETAYPQFIAYGVTGIRDAGSAVPLDEMIQWRREILAGTLVGPPRQILSGPSINDLKERPKCPGDHWVCIPDGDSAAARRIVDSLIAAGADMIKPRNVSAAMYFVIAAEARRLGVPFGGHVEQETAIEASDSGARIVDHVEWGLMPCWTGKRPPIDIWKPIPPASVAQCRRIAERFRQNGTWFMPDLSFDLAEIGTYSGPIFQALEADSSLPNTWLRDPIRAKALQAPDTVAFSDSLGMLLIQRVGLPIVAGTDTEGARWGLTLHSRLAMYVAEGLTPLNALQSATLNPAKMLRGTDSLGTVAPGKLADLVLLDADPLADITNTTTIRAVVANGRYFDRTELDELLPMMRRKP